MEIRTEFVLKLEICTLLLVGRMGARRAIKMAEVITTEADGTDGADEPRTEGCARSSGWTPDGAGEVGLDKEPVRRA